jgi:hypothetical protein
MTPTERSLLELLDAILRSSVVRAKIQPIVQRVGRELARDPTAVMAWEPLPLDVYGDALPPLIRSSWVFILRKGATTGAERHPNSHQRMMSFQGTGDMQTGGEGCWQSNVLVSEQEADLEQKWISIPPNVWHQVVVPEGVDWVVVSFHTVPAEDLIEERPDVADTSRTRQRLYLAPGEQSQA